ncbi:hypothetical protein GMJAKD_12245 [Candidatus Electrothrix aarhusensis]
MYAIKNNVHLASAILKKLNQDSRQTFSILVVNQDGKHIGTLSCVDRAVADNPSVISELTAWRKRYMLYFMTQFEATFARTKTWIDNVVIPSSNRIFFLLRLPDGEAVGNLGICNLKYQTGELDNVIRGKKCGDPQLIYFAVIALFNWGFYYLDYEEFTLHVFSNNNAAIRLYLSLGFTVLQSIPLVRQTSDELVEYIQNAQHGEPVDFFCTQMGITKEIFYNKHPWMKNVCC